MKFLVSLICGALITAMFMIIAGNNGVQISDDGFEQLFAAALGTFILRLLMEADSNV